MKIKINFKMQQDRWTRDHTIFPKIILYKKNYRYGGSDYRVKEFPPLFGRSGERTPQKYGF